MAASLRSTMGLLKLLDIRIRERWSARSKSARPTDSLDSFNSEYPGGAFDSGPDASKVSEPAVRGYRTLAVVLSLAILISAGFSGYFVQKWRPLPVEAASALLTIESDPVGAEVLAAGVRRGRTPLTLTLPPGEHVFEVVLADRRKTLRARTHSGAAVVHHLEFEPRISAAVPLAPVAVEPPPRVVKPAPAAAPRGQAVGWLKVNSAVPLEIREGNDVIGTSRSSRIMMPAGRHELQLANETLGVFERRTVQLLSGNTASITINVPKAPLSINAVPWAEVWVDGIRVGATPIGNHLVPVGTHDVVFRHPELGERQQTVTVSLKGPARVSTDMRKPQ
jgi:PEGA domain